MAEGNQPGVPQQEVEAHGKKAEDESVRPQKDVEPGFGQGNTQQQKDDKKENPIFSPPFWTLMFFLIG